MQACHARPATQTAPATATATHRETAEGAEEEDWVSVDEHRFNPFDELDVEFLDRLQTVLEENGLNSEEGVAKLSEALPLVAEPLDSARDHG